MCYYLRIVFCLLVFFLTQQAKAIELHPFIYIGGTFVDNSTDAIFERSKEHRYHDELKARQTLGLTLLHNRYGVSVSSNRFLNKPIKENIFVANYKLTLITTQYQDNITFSYKLTKRFGLNLGLANVNYTTNIVELQKKETNNFQAYSIGCNMQILKPLYLLFSYSPSFLNTFKKEKTNYYGLGAVVYFM